MESRVMKENFGGRSLKVSWFDAFKLCDRNITRLFVYEDELGTPFLWGS